VSNCVRYMMAMFWL